jgi:branched-chain amino acid transport system permease protein
MMKRAIIQRQTGLRQIALVLLCAGAIAALPLFVHKAYPLHVLNLAMIYVPLAIGANIITGYCGMVSMGQAAFFGIGAYTSALLMMRLGAPWLVAFFGAGALASLLGVAVALPCLRVRSDFLSLMTIAFGQIFLVVVNAWMDLTRGPMGLPGVPRIQLAGWVAHTEADIWYVTATVALLAAWGTARIAGGPIGRAWEMVRDDEIAAQALGVNLTRSKMLAFGVGCFLSGLAGSLFAHELRLVSPDAFIAEESLLIMQMAILGGLASIPGSILGAALMIGVPEALRSSVPALIIYRPGIVGILLLVMMIWCPQGILGRRRAAPPMLLAISDTLRRSIGLAPWARQL